MFGTYGIDLEQICTWKVRQKHPKTHKDSFPSLQDPIIASSKILQLWRSKLWWLWCCHTFNSQFLQIINIHMLVILQLKANVWIAAHCRGLETFEFLVYTLYSKTKTNSTFIAYSKAESCKHNLVLNSSKDKKEY